MVISGD